MGKPPKTLCLTLKAEPESVPRARRALNDFAAAAGADRGQLDAVRLASSEAMTNAVVHAYHDRAGDVYVTAALVSNELWILVADDGCGLKPRADRPGLGLGLGLISQVVDDMAVVARARGGTEVRMRFDLGDGGFTRRRAAPAGEATRNGRSNHRPRRRSVV